MENSTLDLNKNYIHSHFSFHKHSRLDGTHLDESHTINHCPYLSYSTKC